MLQLLPPTTVAVLRAMEIIISYLIQACPQYLLHHCQMFILSTILYISSPRQNLKMISHPPKALVMAEVPDELALSGSSLVVLSVLAFALEQPILSLVSKD